MAVVYDKLLGTELLHTHDGMIVNSIILVDSNGVQWELTVDTDGALITTPLNQIQSGNPVGLLLSLTYPATP